VDESAFHFQIDVTGELPKVLATLIGSVFPLPTRFHPELTWVVLVAEIEFDPRLNKPDNIRPARVRYLSARFKFMLKSLK